MTENVATTKVNLRIGGSGELTMEDTKWGADEQFFVTTLLVRSVLHCQSSQSFFRQWKFRDVLLERGEWRAVS